MWKEFLKTQPVTNIRVINSRTWVSNVFVGVGFAYAIEQEKYYQLPLSYLFPSIYIGYHLYKKKEDIFLKLKKS